MVKVADAPIEINLPRMTEKEFIRFCRDNRDLRIERDKNGNIIIMAAAFSLTGIYEGIVNRAVANWNAEFSNGWVFSASAGFKLPNTAIRAADTAWIANENWQALSKEAKKGFAQICPEFVVEVRSETDRLKAVKAKMQEWIENGAQLGWLIDPTKEKVWIYRADGTVTEVVGFDNTLSGENVLTAFTFDLNLMRI